MDFSATLEPPGFTTSGTHKHQIHGLNFQLRDGTSRKLNLRGHLVVTTQADVKIFTDAGWTVVAVTHATAGGNQG